MNKIRVLFICVQNSARSQMAEAFLNRLAGDQFEAESAGLEPGALNPLVVQAMGEEGIDISGNSTDSVWEYYRLGRLYHFVITVCDQAAENRCPAYPGVTKRLSWPFDDPSAFTGTDEEKLARVRLLRDQIRAEVINFIETHHLVKF